MTRISRQAQGYQTIEVRPLAGAIGAEVLGVDLRNQFDDDEIAKIRAAFLAHHVIFFREQELTAAEFERFVRRFGPLDPHHVLRGMEDHPNVLDIVRRETDRYIFAPGWHADVTWQEKPVLGAMFCTAWRCRRAAAIPCSLTSTWPTSHFPRDCGKC